MLGEALSTRDAPKVATRPLRILLVHTHYQERGGEDVVFDAEGRLLEELGHQVVRYERHNDEVDGMSLVRLGARTIWSREAHRDVARIAAELRPDIAHVHNTLPLLSPSVHHALADAGAAVVQTLHNFRLLCPQGLMLRDGRPCESCVGRTVAWPGVAHACYRDSRAATAAVTAMLATHRALGTWRTRVHAFIALSEFARGRFLAGGLPADRIHVRRAFIDPDPGVGDHRGDFVLYVGRLSREKGVLALLDAWRSFTSSGRGARLVVVGDGPLAPQVAEAANELPGLDWLGAQPRDRVLDLMGQARALVFPSICYENAPTVIAEAFARGLPVLASRLGSMPELVRDGETGWLFAPGDAADIAATLARVHHESSELAGARQGARAAFVARHGKGSATAALMGIYEAAMRARG